MDADNKNVYLKIRTGIFFLILFFTIGEMLAQSGVFLHWDSEVGCLYYEGSSEYWGIDVDQISENQCITVCEGSTLNFTLYYRDSLRNGSIENVSWSSDGGDIVQQNFYSSGDTLATAEVMWPKPQEDASITIKIQGDEEFIVTQCITVKPKPEADFDVVAKYNEFYCNHTDIYFDNHSEAHDGSQISHYLWDFDDGQTSAAKEPVHSYESPGTYEVSLTVYDECNCSSTYTKTIDVIGQSYEINCPTVTCEGSLETYYLEAPPHVDWDVECEKFPWQVDGGQIIQNGNHWVDVLWNDIDEDGFGYIYFDQENCHVECNNVLGVKVPVITEEGFIKGGKDGLCAGEQSRYVLPQWPTTDFNWTVYKKSNGNQMPGAIQLVDQRNEIVVNTTGLSAGNYILRSDYTNTLLKCGGIAEYEFEVYEPLEIDSPKIACEGEDVRFMLTNSNLTAAPNWKIKNDDGELLWSERGDEINYNFDEKGQYKISVNAPEYCKDVVTIEITEVPDITGSSIEGPDEVCPLDANQFVFNGDAKNSRIKWEVDHGSFLGTHIGDTVNISFHDNYSSFQVNAYLVNRDNENCVSDAITKSIDEYFPDVDIYSKEHDTSNDPLKFCPSFESDFTLQGDDLESDTYEWFIEPKQLANVSKGQDTDDVTILFNEEYNGQDQGKIFVKARVCGKLKTVDSLAFKLKGKTDLSIDSAPNSICAAEDFDITVSSNQNLNITDPQNDMKITFDNGQMFKGGVENSSTSFTFENIYLNNLSPNQGNVNINYTIEITGNCGIATTNGSITEIPAPLIDLSVKDNSKVFCHTGDINTVLEASVQGNYNQSSFEWYHNGIQINGPNGHTIDLANWSQGFGEYTVSVSNSDNCTTESNIIHISEDCSGSDPGPGECNQTQDITLNAQWDDCESIKLTGNYSTYAGINPTDYTWLLESDFTNGNAELFDAPSDTLRYYKTKAAGKYYFGYKVDYPNCEFIDLDAVVVGYVPMLNTEIICDGNQFDITMINNSSYYDDFISQTNISYTITNLSNGSNESLSSYNDDEAFATLNPGDYKLELELSRAGYPTCQVSDTIHLNLPDASFSLPKTQYCKEEKVVLNPDNIVQENTYTWNFDEATNKRGSTRINHNPKITPYLSEGQGINVILTAEGPYGCMDKDTLIIDILEANFEGEIKPDDGIICAGGGSVELSYDSQDPRLSGYQWYRGMSPIPGATQKDYTATQEGEYYVYLTDQDGCIDKKNDGVYVKKAYPPELYAEITEEICEGDSLIISGVLSPDIAEYEIEHNGVIVQGTRSGPEVDFATVPSSPGIYDYTVKYRNPDTGCKDSTNFSTKVFPYPDIQVNYEFISCEPYTYKVYATNVPQGPGTLAWSNGATGDTITVDHGGRYQVRYQSGDGPCSATADVYVPQSPEKYMWIFPDGCYTYCFDNPDIPDKFIIGPIPEFDYYDWSLDGYLHPVGSGEVADYGLASQNGELNMTLQNDCGARSAPLHLTTGEGCEEQCEVDLGDYYAEPYFSEPFKVYQIHGFLTGGFGLPVKVVWQSPDGYFIPGNIMLPPGGYNFMNNPLTFMPNSGFSGNSIDVKLIFYHHNEVICTYETSIQLPVPYPYSTSIAEMTVTPNPFSNQTEIRYDFGDMADFNQGTLELFSLDGLLLRQYTIDTAQGDKKLNLSELASGSYIVLLRYHGQTFGQQIIIKK